MADVLELDNAEELEVEVDDEGDGKFLLHFTFRDGLR